MDDLVGEVRRPASVVPILGIVLMAIGVGFAIWWRGTFPVTPPTTVPISPSEMDVVCMGRVDAARALVSLDPSEVGRVVAISVNEGDHVRAGQEIYRLDDERAKAKFVQAEAMVAAAAVEVEAANADAARLPGQLNARRHLLAAATARAEAARKMVQQRREQQSLAPFSKLEQESADAQIRELELMEEAERSQTEELAKTDPQIRVRLAEAKLKAAEADRDLARKGVRETVVVAPADGKILRLHITTGGLIAPGSVNPAVVFAPAGPLIIRAEVDQEFLGRVQPGMSASIQDENRVDGKTWAGKVRSIAGWVATRRTFVLDPGEVNDIRTVECVIDIEPPATDLWIGQQMRVRILREK